MSETTTCPTCGTPVRVVSDSFGEGTNHYEPLGLDALTQMLADAAVRRRNANAAVASFELHRDRLAEIIREQHEAKKAFDLALADLIAAAAAS